LEALAAIVHLALTQSFPKGLWTSRTVVTGERAPGAKSKAGRASLDWTAEGGCPYMGG